MDLVLYKRLWHLILILNTLLLLYSVSLRRDEENRMIREEEERRREMLMRGDMGMRGPGGPRNQMEQV